MGVMAKKQHHTRALAEAIMTIQAEKYPPSIETYVKINIQNHYSLYNFFVNRQLIIMGDFRPHTLNLIGVSHCSMALSKLRETRGAI